MFAEARYPKTSAENTNDDDSRSRSSSLMLPVSNIPQSTGLLIGDSMGSLNPRAISRSRTREQSHALFINDIYDGDLDDDDDLEIIMTEDVPDAAMKKFRLNDGVKFVPHIKTEPIKQEGLDDHTISGGHDSRHDSKISGRLTYTGGHDKSMPIDLTQTPETTDYQPTDVVFLTDDEEDSKEDLHVIDLSDDENIRPPISSAGQQSTSQGKDKIQHIDLDDDTVSNVAVVRLNLQTVRKEYIQLTSKRDKLKAKEAQGILCREDTKLLEKLEEGISEREKIINDNEGDDGSSDSDDDEFDDFDDYATNDHVDEAENGLDEEDTGGKYVEDDPEDEYYEQTNEIDDDDDDGDDEYLPTETKNTKKRKRVAKSQAPRSKRVSGISAKTQKTKKPKTKRSKKQQGSRPASAQEWWKREYEKNSEADAIPNFLVPNGRTNPKQAATWQPGGAHDEQVLDMLKDIDPVNARAAMDTTLFLDEGTATTRQAQEAQLKANLKIINDSMVQKDARKEMSLLKKAMGSFGHGKCKITNGRYLLPGMNTPLFNHQLVGVHFMLGKEFSPLGPYGGILADQMGLGKTVQMLACMAQNQGDGPTLIVAPAAAIEQWKSELKRHCTFATRIWQYSDKNANQDPETLKEEKVVIASYQAIAQAFPSDEALRRIGGMKLGLDEWRDQLTGEMGDAFLVDWHRVVLDEAHAIKNHLSRTSKACVHLRSKHRWALTGTPIHNSIEELYPYMRFLKVEWAADMHEFKKKFGRTPGDDESEKARLAAVVPSLMIRRRVHDTFMGQPILRIPPTHPVKTISVELSTEENLIYRRLEARFRDNLNSHIKEGVNTKKMRTYFTYLTRLRQCTSHPFLLETSLRRDFELEDIVWLRQQLAEVGGQTPLRTHISKWINDEEARRLEKDNNGDGGMDFGTTDLGKSAFGGLFEMDEQLERIEAEKTAEDHICRSCTELAQDSQITEPCGHSFCMDCIEPVVHNAEISNQEPKCPHCSTVVKRYKRMPKPVSRNKGYDEDTDAEAVEQPDESVRAPGKRKKKARTKKGPEPGDDAQGLQPRSPDITKFLELCDRTPDKPVTPSAKTTAIKMQVLEWLHKYPDDKIISEIRASSFALLLPLTLRVVIASTRCGGQALNLTAANRVILVDLWWNTAVERQAFGRVHRIGQTKDTYYVKIVTRKTIDERLLDMQGEKDARISETLQDGERKAKPLTYADIRYLIAGDDDDNNLKIDRHRDRNDDATVGGNSDQREEDISSDDEGGNGVSAAVRQGQKRPLGAGADTQKAVKRRRPSKRGPKSNSRATNEDSGEDKGPGGSQEEGTDESQGGLEPTDGPDEPDGSASDNGVIYDPEGAYDSDLPRPSIEGSIDPTDTSVAFEDLGGDFAVKEIENREVPVSDSNPFVDDASDSEED
ncbi:hypothetical protein PpBr36_04611 [Pyricularia pennisetigena]|uniref:hypothetical protein n=1 Tax=Pyricularia pennisetigena TaxID=1578925 RepID=UPI001151A47E|nr:hypothetical protein PpBr36_04611 [Pyricularia pennisetigena]TLS27138.1 hypothetical protein PpBr36_04611 [Pyricularia pennisetigena]